MKILAIGELDRLTVTRLETNYKDFVYGPSLSAELLSESVKQCDVLITRYKNQITQSFLQKAPAVKIIIQAATGTDNVDLTEVKKNNISFYSAPSVNSSAVAEYTILVMLAMARKFKFTVNITAEGRWAKEDCIGYELQGKKMGIVGVGKVGTRLSELCKAFGMEISGLDPFVEDSHFESIGIKRCYSLQEISATSDFLSLHVPLTAATRHMISNTFFAGLSRAIFLINTSRGAVIDEKALLHQLNSPLLRGIALDVFEAEPDLNLNLVGHAKVISSPHIAGVTVDSLERLGLFVMNKLKEILPNE